MNPLDPKATLEQRQQALAALIKQLSANDWPIVFGPWRSELGFEGLYAVPFVRQLASQVPQFAARTRVLTRGGTASLYLGVADRPTVDLYALRSVTELRRENLYDHRVRHNAVTQKQIVETDWDRQVVTEAVNTLGIPHPYHLVHPSFMYWLYTPWWEEHTGLRYLTQMANYEPIRKPPLPVDCPLPPRYVAVKFYGRVTFPFPHPDTNDMVRQIIATLAAQTQVVLLTEGDEYDDHIDGRITGPNIIALPKVPAEHNLAVQVAVLAHATAFVGTYGGVAQLALRLGVPSVSLYTEWGGTAHAHLTLSSWLSKAYKVPFLVGSIGDVHLWKQLTSLPARTVQPATALVPG